MDYKKIAYWALLGWEVAVAKFIWQVTLAIWQVVLFVGRMTLWVMCWPLGLWRSVRRGSNRRHDKLVKALTEVKR